MDHAARFFFHARDGIDSVRCVCLGFFLPFALVVVLRQGSFQAALALSHLQVRDHELHFFSHHQVLFGTAVVHVRACLRIVSEMLSHFRRRDGGVECAQDGQVDRRSSHTCHGSTHAASWLRLEDQHPGRGVHTHVGVERMDPSWTTLHVQLVVREQDPLDVVSPPQQPLVQVRCDPSFHSLDVARRQVHAQGSRPTHQPRAHRSTNTHVSSPTCDAAPTDPRRRVSSLLGVPSSLPLEKKLPRFGFPPGGQVRVRPSVRKGGRERERREGLKGRTEVVWDRRSWTRSDDENMAQPRFSGTVKLDAGDLSDYIAPAQNCVVGKAGKETKDVQHEVKRHEKEEAKPVKVTLHDCLACRCVNQTT